ncbi:hypothetical protein G4B88_007558 [Cannabis sativa]|uniref:FAT domain-containing protein n=1 Tax=Cannabis sativa TaxID=3483 RepID=A0A7J6HU41_CANSA|nr:hypothetical protein G4B88_007558 [Cannabis sativa]
MAQNICGFTFLTILTERLSFRLFLGRSEGLPTAISNRRRSPTSLSRVLSSEGLEHGMRFRTGVGLLSHLRRMRCLAALACWEELNNFCKEYWTPVEPAARLEMASMAANAAWNMGEWDQMAEYVSRLDDGDETKLRGLANTAASGDGSSNGTFFKAVLLVRRGKYDEAREYVERARKCLATGLAALCVFQFSCGLALSLDLQSIWKWTTLLTCYVSESYERAYTNMVRVQQLSELEEVIDYCTLPLGNSVAEGRRALIRNMWTERIQGAKRNVEVWQVLLAVRALVLPPTEDTDNWLKFASLCRQSGRISQARSTLFLAREIVPRSDTKLFAVVIIIVDSSLNFVRLLAIAFKSTIDLPCGGTKSLADHRMNILHPEPQC